MNDIILNAFADELEKVAGMPRAVASGGGGAWGKIQRVMASRGKSISARSPFSSAGDLADDVAFAQAQPWKEGLETGLKRGKPWLISGEPVRRAPRRLTGAGEYVPYDPAKRHSFLSPLSGLKESERAIRKRMADDAWWARSGMDHWRA